MTKKSWFFLGVIIVCLVVMVAHRSREIYDVIKGPSFDTREAETDRRFEHSYDFSYDSGGKEVEAPPAQSTAFFSIPWGQNDFPDKPYEPSSVKMLMQDELVLQELEEASAARAEALKDKARAAFSKYENTPVALRMAEEFRAAGFDGMNFTGINGPDFAKMASDPVFMEIAARYMKDPEFIDLMRTAFSDPFVRAVAAEIEESNR